MPAPERLAGPGNKPSAFSWLSCDEIGEGERREEGEGEGEGGRVVAERQGWLEAGRLEKGWGQHQRLSARCSSLALVLHLLPL